MHARRTHSLWHSFSMPPCCPARPALLIASARRFLHHASKRSPNLDILTVFNAWAALGLGC